MLTIEGAGVALAYDEHGSGPCVLLVHGIAADARSVLRPFAALADEARVIAYDRRGYGDSGEPEPYERTTVEEQAEDAAALLGELDAVPALVCGDDLGALIALDLLKRHAELVAAAVLSDPPLFAFVAAATEALGAQRGRLEERLRDAGPEAAVDDWLGERADADARARARTAHRAFFADLAGLTSWSVARRELRAIAAPVAIVTGDASPRHVVAAADALEQLLPDVRRRRDGDALAAARELLA